MTPPFLSDNPYLWAIAILWTLPWKGVALWRAAHAERKGWFIALLVVNTFGLLEILYIFVFSRNTTKPPDPTS